MRITDDTSKFWSEHRLVKRFSNIVDFEATDKRLVLINNLGVRLLYTSFKNSYLRVIIQEGVFNKFLRSDFFLFITFLFIHECYPSPFYR